MKERYPVTYLDDVRALAPVLTTPSLMAWFGSLEYVSGPPRRETRIVSRPETGRIGLASIRMYESRVNTTSVEFVPGDGSPGVTVRARRQVVSRDPTQYRPFDYLGEDGGGELPEWRQKSPSAHDLIVPGTWCRRKCDPEIATVTAALDGELTALQAEQALLAFGAILLTHAATAETVPTF